MIVESYKLLTCTYSDKLSEFFIINKYDDTIALDTSDDLKKLY